MVISDQHRFLFIEIPHTGSHSISQQLTKHYGGKAILRKHSNVTQFLGQATRDQRSYFKFATVRNPLDAIATDYMKLKNNHKEQFTRPEMRIENGGHVTKEHLREFQFIQDNAADFPTFFREFRAKLYNNWFLVGDQHFDYVIRFESLQEGFTEVLKRLEIDQQEPIPHVNRTKGKERPFEELYTPDIHPLVAACLGPFMEKWRYQLPAAWGDVRIPLSSRFQFSLLTRSAGFAANFTTLDPNSPILYRAKKTLDLLTRK